MPEPQLPALLVAFACAIVFMLGFMHLVLTFRGVELHPRDPALMSSMQTVSPVITRQTTMWKAWIGFNASHSYGALLFGLVYGYLALAVPELFFASVFLRGVGLALLAGYLVLAWRYWFSAPRRGLIAATLLYALGLALGG